MEPTHLCEGRELLKSKLLIKLPNNIVISIRMVPLRICCSPAHCDGDMHVFTFSYV